MKRFVQKTMEAAIETIRPIKDVRDARERRISGKLGKPIDNPIVALDRTDEKDSRLSGDNGDTNIRDLGIGMGLIFGGLGDGILIADLVRDGNFQELGYGSLAIGMFGAAVAFREMKIDLESRG